MYGADISADGRAVAFATDATNLVAGDTNGYPDVFVQRHAGCGTLGAVESGAALDVGKGRVVGVRGFEHATPASRTQCSTRLSYTPIARRGL